MILSENLHSVGIALIYPTHPDLSRKYQSRYNSIHLSENLKADGETSKNKTRPSVEDRIENDNHHALYVPLSLNFMLLLLFLILNLYYELVLSKIDAFYKSEY